MTLKARRGDDAQLKADFEKSIQDSYDQGLFCAKCLNDGQYYFKASRDDALEVDVEFKEIYIFCVVSDHYPALAFQARQFLVMEETAVIRAPFVMDVFFLDVMCEMLPSPLYLLSYVNRRVGYSERIMASHEWTILGYHLKRNLWINDEINILVLEDDLATDIDISMAVRRTGIPGADIPPGILTVLGTSPVKRLLEQIEYLEEPVTVDLGFHLLRLGSAALDDLGKSMGQQVRKARAQGRLHDLSLMLPKSGMTIHFNADSNETAMERLRLHCMRRKYVTKADSWFGVCVNPDDAQLRFGIGLDSPWQQSTAMDETTKLMSVGHKTFAEARSAPKRQKIGRNDPCACGSGKKFKKCCLVS